MKTLSDKIEELKKEMKVYANLNDGQINGIIKLVTHMNKNFIKQLKKELSDYGKDFITYDWICETIDTLAGDKLISPLSHSPATEMGSVVPSQDKIEDTLTIKEILEIIDSLNCYKCAELLEPTINKEELKSKLEAKK